MLCIYATVSLEAHDYTGHQDVLLCAMLPQDCLFKASSRAGDSDPSGFDCTITHALSGQDCCKHAAAFPTALSSCSQQNLEAVQSL